MFIRAQVVNKDVILNYTIKITKEDLKVTKVSYLVILYMLL